MTWIVIDAKNALGFEQKIKEYEAMGYKLHPESFRFVAYDRNYSPRYVILMKKEEPVEPWPKGKASV